MYFTFIDMQTVDCDKMSVNRMKTTVNMLYNNTQNLTTS